MYYYKCPLQFMMRSTLLLQQLFIDGTLANHKCLKEAHEFHNLLVCHILNFLNTADACITFYTRSNTPRTGLSGLLSSNSLNLPFNQAVDPVLLDIPHYPADYCMVILIFLLQPLKLSRCFCYGSYPIAHSPDLSSYSSLTN